MKGERLKGEHLRMVREAADMLQPEFATELGVHPVTLSRFERERDPINKSIELAIYELATRFGVRDILPAVKPRKLASRKKTK